MVCVVGGGGRGGGSWASQRMGDHFQRGEWFLYDTIQLLEKTCSLSSLLFIMVDVYLGNNDIKCWKVSYWQHFLLCNSSCQIEGTWRLIQFKDIRRLQTSVTRT